MLSVNKIKEKIKAATTCVELCILLSGLDIPNRVKILSDPSGIEKLSELIKTTSDVLELEKVPLDLELHKPLSALLTPIYSKALMANIQETAKTIQQNLSNVHLLSWLTYEDRNLVLESFDPNLTVADPQLNFLFSYTITNQQLGSLLSYLDQSGHELALKKYQDKLPTLVQNFENVLIFQNVSFDVWPESLRHICAKILIKHPLETAAIINSNHGKTPLLPALCYKINSKNLSHVLIHLNDAACTEMIKEVCTFDLISDTNDMLTLTEALIEHGRDDLFSNQTLRKTCTYIIVNVIDDIINNLEYSEDNFEYEFDYLFYSSFWFDSSTYNKLILTPLTEENDLLKIVETNLQLSNLLSLSLDRSSDEIILNALKDKLPQLIETPEDVSFLTAALHSHNRGYLLQHPHLKQICMSVLMQYSQQPDLVPAYLDNIIYPYDTVQREAIGAVCLIGFFRHEIPKEEEKEKVNPLDWSSSEGESESRKRKETGKENERANKRFRTIGRP